LLGFRGLSRMLWYAVARGTREDTTVVFVRGAVCAGFWLPY
jgi:hypothetical protein